MAGGTSLKEKGEGGGGGEEREKGRKREKRRRRQNPRPQDTFSQQKKKKKKIHSLCSSLRTEKPQGNRLNSPDVLLNLSPAHSTHPTLKGRELTSWFERSLPP